MKIPIVIVILAGILISTSCIFVNKSITNNASRSRTAISDILIDDHGRKYYVSQENRLIYDITIWAMFGGFAMIVLGVYGIYDAWRGDGSG